MTQQITAIAHEIGARRFAHLLTLLRDEASPWGRGNPCPIAISACLAEAWRPDRLARCAALLAEGSEAPPVSAIAYRLGKSLFFDLSDGNHRVIAARHAGRKTIRAAVGGLYILDPAAFGVRNGCLWRHEGNGRWRFVWDVEPRDVEPLIRLGVRKSP